MSKVGGIKDSSSSENSLEIDSLARFAVDEHNKKSNGVLELGKVVKTKEQVVAGMMYFITLEAKDGDKNKLYEAKVWVKPRANSKELQDFKFLGDA